MSENIKELAKMIADGVDTIDISELTTQERSDISALLSGKKPKKPDCLYRVWSKSKKKYIGPWNYKKGKTWNSLTAVWSSLCGQLGTVSKYYLERHSKCDLEDYKADQAKNRRILEDLDIHVYEVANPSKVLQATEVWKDWC